MSYLHGIDEFVFVCDLSDQRTDLSMLLSEFSKTNRTNIYFNTKE